MTEVFVSWSGSRAKAVARSLRDWIPCVLQSVRPWMSEGDLDAGSRWQVELAKKLQQVNFGIICLTPETVNTPWVLFHCCPAKSRIDSTGCRDRVNRVGSPMLEEPVKWAPFQKARCSESVEFGRDSHPAPGACGRSPPGHKPTRQSKSGSSRRSRWYRKRP